MSDQQKPNWIIALAEVAKAWASTDFPALLGFGVMMLCMISLPILVMQWDGHIHDRKGCVQLQEINGKLFVVDTCTGKVEEYKGKDAKALVVLPTVTPTH